VGDERNATDGLHACRAEGADDFVLEAVDFRARAENGWPSAIARAEGDVSRGTVTSCLISSGDREIEVVDLEQSGLGIEEREAGVVVVDDALQVLTMPLKRSGVRGW